MTEVEFQAQVVEYATWTKWRTYHTFDSRRSNSGFPDLVMVRSERVLFVELKSEKGRVSPSQGEWLADLYEAGMEAYVWRPSDWAWIEETLR